MLQWQSIRRGTPLEKRFDPIEIAIVSGRIDEARSRLSAWDGETRGKSPAARLKAAELARRSGLHTLALRLLHPLVRGSEKSPARATPEAATEYAGSLVQIGARSEARDILEAIEPARVPVRDLFLAFAHFAEWDYELALAPLRRYTESKMISEYQRKIGALNLAAALVATNLRDEAGALLGILLTDPETPPLLKMNALEVQAQLWIASGDYPAAWLSLEEASESARRLSGTYDLLIEKWRAVLGLRSSRGSQASRASLESVREKAVQGKRWEVVRDCDFHLADTASDVEIAKRLYFGTPFESYRRRVLGIAGESIAKRGYDWQPLGTAERFLDVSHTTTDKVHTLLRALCADFYRPQRLGELFAMLYPGEQYSPGHSASKMNQLIVRVRRWLDEEALPIHLRIEESAARLVFRHPVTVRVAVDGGVKNENLASLEPNCWYANRDLRSRLGLSARTINRLVAEAVTQGQLVARGAGKTKRYKLSE